MKKRNIGFAAITLLLGLPCSGQANPNQALPAITSQAANYTITISPPSSPLSLQAPLLVEVYYTNTTTSTIYLKVMVCSICTAEQMFLTKDGKEVEPTPFQRMSTARGLPSDFKDAPRVRGHTVDSRFPPGVFWKYNLDLRKLYNISEPGRYTLSASRTEDTRDGKIVVRSNTVTLDIVP